MTAKWGQGSHEREASGRFEKSPPCDACGKSTGREYGTDDAVCGSTDGPGFFLCSRVRCGKTYEGLDVEARRTLFTAQRARNKAAGAAGGFWGPP